MKIEKEIAKDIILSKYSKKELLKMYKKGIKDIVYPRFPSRDSYVFNIIELLNEN